MDLGAELAEVEDAESFVSVASARLRAALDVDVTAYCEWHPAPGAAGLVVLAPDGVVVTEEGAAVWARHHHEDLWIRHITATTDHRAVRLTDISSRAELSRSATYQGCYRPSGFRFMAHLPLALDPGTSAALGIGRVGRDLDDETMLLFEGLRRPFASTRRRLLRQGRLPAGPRTPLTRRQADVLTLVAGGMTNEQIALRLGVRPRTVKKHLECIYARLGVPNRAAAAVRWTADGAVPAAAG